MKKLIDFLNRLEENKIFYKLNKVNDEYIMVEVAVPGERWEIEFSNDDVRVERFFSNGEIFDESEIKILFRDFTI